MSLDDRNAELDKKLENGGVDQSIQALTQAARKSDRRVRLLALSLLLDLLLTVGLAVVSVKTNETAHLAQTSKAAILANCQVSNESRKNNRDLWNFAFSLSPEQPQTPEQQARVKDFKDFVNKTFADRDCQAEINKQ